MKNQMAEKTENEMETARSNEMHTIMNHIRLSKGRGRVLVGFVRLLILLSRQLGNVGTSTLEPQP